MLTRILATLTLVFVTSCAAPAPSRALQAAAHLQRARIVDDVEGCRVPPPSPAPVALATCSDEARL